MNGLLYIITKLQEGINFKWDVLQTIPIFDNNKNWSTNLRVSFGWLNDKGGMEV